jgi:hypothetical protein
MRYKNPPTIEYTTLVFFVIILLAIFLLGNLSAMISGDVLLDKRVQEEKMELIEHQIAFTRDIAKLVFFAKIRGMGLTYGDAYRTELAQMERVDEGSSRTMNSYHRKRLAVDFNLFINGEYLTNPESYEPLGKYWESLSPHNVWGGRFGDANHFERRP